MGEILKKNKDGDWVPVTQDEVREVERGDRLLRVLNSYERTRAAVYATGNKWAIENFEATH